MLRFRVQFSPDAPEDQKYEVEVMLYEHHHQGHYDSREILLALCRMPFVTAVEAWRVSEPEREG